MPLQVHHTTPSLAVASWDSLLVAVFRSAGGIASLQTLALMMRSFSHTYPEGFSLLIWLQRPSMGKTPAKGLKEEAQQLGKEFSNRMIGVGLVLDADGLAGAVVRTVVTAVSMLHRTEIPVKVFETLQGATTWLTRLPRQDAALRAEALTLAASVHIRFAPPPDPKT